MKNKKGNMTGMHGNQGRKKTGRVRKYTLPPKFTKKEVEDIVGQCKESGQTQAAYIYKKCMGETERKRINKV